MLGVSAPTRVHAQAGSDDFFTFDSLQRLIAVPTNAVPSSWLPPGPAGARAQSPTPPRGIRVPEPALKRQQRGMPPAAGAGWFPSQQPQLPSYLASNDSFGNTALHPGALFGLAPWDAWIQRGKYALSDAGLNYSLAQTFTVAGLTGHTQGDDVLGFYTFDWAAKWTVFDAPDAGTAGWLSTQVEAKAALNRAAEQQSAQTNLGSLTNPTGIWSRHNGFRIPELAWQQSAAHGEFVMLAGMVSQGNYLDANSYANSGRGQFMNSALINSMVLPLPDYNLGLNVQWQPVSEWYAMAGYTVGAASAGASPWTNFDGNQWSSVGEFGYAPSDVLGLGPGIYRVQPFVAQAGGATQGGLGFNLQQQMGKRIPWGWFGRFGFGGSEVVSGAAAQAGTGFVVQAPLYHLGWINSLPYDAAGIGVVWSRPPESAGLVSGRTETALELGYVLHLTPTTRLQPDVQVVWNPSYSTRADTAVVFQLQVDIKW